MGVEIARLNAGPFSGFQDVNICVQLADKQLNRTRSVELPHSKLHYVKWLVYLICGTVHVVTVANNLKDILHQ